jgi:hypothetical protein
MSAMKIVAEKARDLDAQLERAMADRRAFE